MEQRRLAVGAPQRLVDVGGIAGESVVPLGHEGEGAAERPGDLLAAVLEDDVAVGHVEGLGIAHVDLFLAGAPFALGVLHRNAGAVQAVADGPHDAFFLGGLEDVIVLDVLAGRLEAAVALFAGRVIGLVEQEELELGGEERLHLHCVQALELALEHVARGMLQGRVVVMLEDVAEDQRGLLQPRDAAQRRQVGLHDEVAVALLPARHLVARHRLHLDVVGQQVVAGMGLVVGGLDEILGMEALADQPALHVRKCGDDGVDGTGRLPARAGRTTSSGAWGVLMRGGQRAGAASYRTAARKIKEACGSPPPGREAAPGGRPCAAGRPRPR
jgi:hypothetical protein